MLTFGHNPTEDLDPVQLQILTGMLAIIIFGWMTYARVIRGNILALKEFEYAMAARTIGASNMRILFRHLLPNAVFPVLVIASMNIGSYVLTFAALSFLGLGAQRGYADWGQMISFCPELGAIVGHAIGGSWSFRAWPLCCSCWPGTWWAMPCATSWTRA